MSCRIWCLNKIMKIIDEKNEKNSTKVLKKKKRSLQCYLCRVFIKSSISNLRRHMRLHGPVVCCFQCSGCDKKYQNKANLAAHWVKKHKVDLGEIVQMNKSERTATGGYYWKLILLSLDWAENVLHIMLRFSALRSVLSPKLMALRRSDVLIRTTQSIQPEIQHVRSIQNQFQHPTFGGSPKFDVKKIICGRRSAPVGMFSLKSINFPTFTTLEPPKTNSEVKNEVKNEVGQQFEKVKFVWFSWCGKMFSFLHFKHGRYYTHIYGSSTKVDLNFEIPHFGTLEWE